MKDREREVEKREGERETRNKRQRGRRNEDGAMLTEKRIGTQKVNGRISERICFK